MNSTPGEEAVKIVEMTTKHLEYYINLVDKAVAGSERTDSSLERNSAVGKMPPNSIACPREIIRERKGNQCAQLRCCPKKFPQPPQPLATTTLISLELPTSRQKDYPTH